MNDIRSILADAFDEAIASIRANIKDVTGETSGSLEKEIIEEAEYSFTARLLARPYIQTLETGRGPYTGREVSEKGAFARYLAKWCSIRGFPASGLTAEQYERTARWLAWYINKYGDALYRSGARRDVYSSAVARLSETVERRLSGLFDMAIRSHLNRI